MKQTQRLTERTKGKRNNEKKCADVRVCVGGEKHVLKQCNGMGERARNRERGRKIKIVRTWSRTGRSCVATRASQCVCVCVCLGVRVTVCSFVRACDRRGSARYKCVLVLVMGACVN